MTATSIPLFLLLVGGLILSVNCLMDPLVPASFYPFGTDENDNVVPVGDDVSSPTVSMSTEFPFLFGNYSRIYVSILSVCIATFKRQLKTHYFNIYLCKYF